MMKIKFIVFITFILIGNGYIQADSFSNSKKILKELYKAQPETFYCGCGISWLSKNKLVPVVENCGYKPRIGFTRNGKINERARRIEFEHVVSAWEFGHQLQCWQNGGRKNCNKTSEKFNEMESDLINLQAVLGELNGDRSNFKYGMIEAEKRVYGSCNAEVDFKAKIFEPKEDRQGDIARTYFYFEKEYGLKISDKQKKLFNVWAKIDPVSKNECQMHELKSRYQKRINVFISEECNKYR